MRDQIEVTRKDLGGHETRLNFIHQSQGDFYILIQKGIIRAELWQGPYTIARKHILPLLLELIENFQHFRNRHPPTRYATTLFLQQAGDSVTALSLDSG